MITKIGQVKTTVCQQKQDRLQGFDSDKAEQILGGPAKKQKLQQILVWLRTFTVQETYILKRKQ